MKDFSSFAPIIIIVIISVVSKILKAKKKPENKTTYFDKKGKPINLDSKSTKKKSVFSYIEDLKNDIVQQEQKEVLRKNKTNLKSIRKASDLKKVKQNETVVGNHTNKERTENLNWKDKEITKPKPDKLLNNKNDLKKAIIFSEILKAKYVD